MFRPTKVGNCAFAEHHLQSLIVRPCRIEPSAAEIQLDLTQKEAEHGTGTGTVAWIAEGINLRAAQYVAELGVVL